MISLRLNSRSFVAVLFSVFLLILAFVPVEAEEWADRDNAAVAAVRSPSGTGSSLDGDAKPSAADSAFSPAIERIRQMMDESGGSVGNDPTSEDDAEVEGEGGGPGLAIFLWLAFVVVLIVGCAWALRRFVGGRIGNAGGQIRVVASCPLSPRSRLFVVEIGDDRFLVGEGGGSVSLITQLASPPATVNTPAAPQDRPMDPTDSTFADRLRQWEHSVSGRTVSGEVKASLRLVEALTRRLRRGAATQSEAPDGT